MARGSGGFLGIRSGNGAGGEKKVSWRGLLRGAPTGAVAKGRCSFGKTSATCVVVGRTGGSAALITDFSGGTTELLGEVCSGTTTAIELVDGALVGGAVEKRLVDGAGIGTTAFVGGIDSGRVTGSGISAISGGVGVVFVASPVVAWVASSCVSVG